MNPPLLIGPIFDIIKGVQGRVLPNPEAKEKAQAQAFEVLTNGTFDQLWQLMSGMLGLGGLRTYEKIKGSA